MYIKILFNAFFLRSNTKFNFGLVENQVDKNPIENKRPNKDQVILKDSISWDLPSLWWDLFLSFDLYRICATDAIQISISLN